MNSIVVTGGSGFLATAFVKSIKKKNIYLISRKKLKKNINYKNIVCDLTNKSKTMKALQKINPKEIYHFAWSGIPIFNKKNLKDNKIISENLIAGLNKTNCKKIIISGTGAEYGDIKKACYEYSKPSKKISELGRQKNLIRKLFFEKLNKDIVVVWARVFYVYGKNQRDGSLLNELIKAKKNKKYIHLKKPFLSNDFIYIKDVISGILKLKKIKKSKIINISSSKAISNLTFVKTFEKVNNISLVKKSQKKKFKNTKFGINRRLKNLGWNQKYNLEKGLSEVCRQLNKQ